MIFRNRDLEYITSQMHPIRVQEFAQRPLQFKDPCLQCRRRYKYTFQKSDQTMELQKYFVNCDTTHPLSQDRRPDYNLLNKETGHKKASFSQKLNLYTIRLCRKSLFLNKIYLPGQNTEADARSRVLWAEHQWILNVNVTCAIFKARCFQGILHLIEFHLS